MNGPGGRDPSAARNSLPLRIRGLACRRGDRLLFDGFDLDLAPGELVWLRAANGFGKTTLLRIVAGLGHPEAGTIEWSSGRAALYLGHANALKDDLTVIESLQHANALHRLAASPAALDDAIDRFGLRTRRDAPIRTLSQGQRRRVALMRLCLSAPRATWLLDEPFDALDSDGSASVGALLADHAAGGGSALLTSHTLPPLPEGAPLRTLRLDRPDP